MRLAEGIDKQVGICDAETLAGLFDVGAYNPDTKEYREFEISKYRNDLYHFVTWYQSKPYDYLVTFNGIGFDQQVFQFVVNNYQDWYDLTNLEVTQKIYEFVQRHLDNQKYRIALPYKEKKFPIAPLDLFTIHHFDNKARRCSLKWCAFMMNMDVEEMPIHHSTFDLTKEDIRTVVGYRRQDIRVTEKLLQLTLGNIELPELKDYKGKNKIQDRFDVMNETGLNCLNWSDVKIGEEWNKQKYKVLENISDSEDRSLFPKNVKYPYGQKFKKYFPKTMDFTTDLLKKFSVSLGEQSVKADKEQQYLVRIQDTTFVIKKGGIHSNEKKRVIIPAEGYLLRDADVGGQYPNFVIKDKVCPPHLTEGLIDIAKECVRDRSIKKAQAQQLEAEGKDKEARPLIGLQEMLKLRNNGGLFGKMGQEGSWLHYPEGVLRVCLGNEIEILMLVEMMNNAGFHVVSGNTDGIVTYFPKNQEDVYLRICKEWEEKVGNTELGKLEYTDFEGLWQDSINSYIAKKKGGKVKKKGRFLTEFELNKNKSRRIIAMALEEYFINKKDPVQFIKDHKSIYDFLIGKKTYQDLHYEEVTPDGKTIQRGKLVVYYVSVEGSILWKRGFDFNGDPENSYVEAKSKDFPQLGQPLMTYFNRHFEAADYGINYDYYIVETLKRIDAIEKTKKAKRYVETLGERKQMSLW